MNKIPKPIKKELRLLADQAYEAELSRELTALETVFARWRRGEITAFDVTEAVHRYHQGPARELYLRYSEVYPKAAIAYAIHRRILDRARIAPDVMQELALAMTAYEPAGAASGGVPGEG